MKCLEAPPAVCCYIAPAAVNVYAAPRAVCCYKSEDYKIMSGCFTAQCTNKCMTPACERRSDVRSKIPILWSETPKCRNGVELSEDCGMYSSLVSVTHEFFTVKGEALAGDPDDPRIALGTDGVTPLESIDRSSMMSTAYIEGGVDGTCYLLVATATFDDCGVQWTDKRCVQVRVANYY